MAQRRDLRAEWAARPPTVRAWVVLTVGSRVVDVVAGPPRSLVLGVLLTGLYAWGLWAGSRIVWLLALIGAALCLIALLASVRPFPTVGLVLLAVSVTLLIAPSTQEWVKRQELRRSYGPGRGPSGPRAAA